MSEGTDPGSEEADKAPLRRTFDFCVAAPVGVAISVVEELPELITKGRQRVELHLGNALIVGRYVVGKGQRTVSRRLEEFLAPGADVATDPQPAASEPPEPPGRPAPDPAAEAVVAAALADYDTLSASQVVRRLESLGPEQLRAVQRYEASTRNRRTILNRAGQLLEEHPSGSIDDGGGHGTGATGRGG